MPTITLPDGSQRQYDAPISIAEVAASIGEGLARAAIAGKVDGKLVDTSFVIENDVQLALITERDDESLEVIRHSAAHLMAQAVKELFPTAQVTIGPVIDDGFYYDFAYERAFTPDDLQAIETKMKALAKQGFEVKRSVKTREQAIEYFEKIGEKYKAEIIRDIPEGETLSLYTQGEFTDLCRGPHVPNTNKLKVFKLMKVAGAYWRGDSSNEMLQRVYGTAWHHKKDLKAYLTRLEEAEKRDHRKLAKKMDLFHFQEEAPGMVFWHDNGWTIYQVVEQYIRQLLKEHHYQEVRTPQIVDRSLWERSGHWEKFREEMFTTESENHVFAVKPMSCPCHVQIFNQGLKSYRDLPLRMAEFGSCHRNEPSGALHGLMRVRNFVQDDAHIFCTEDHIQQEISALMDMVFELYRTFGFDDVLIKLSTRPERRVGSDELWDKTEQALKDALEQHQVDWQLNPGDGAFYGPKIDLSLKDCLGRVWQCGTIQLDFSTPERLGASYIAEDGSKKIPVMIHRALIGTIERFMGVLLEHYGNAIPPWLAPQQVVILNITDRQAEYCQNIAEIMKKHHFRCKLDLRNEKIGFKIREHTLARVPYLLVIGDRELEDNAVAVRTREGKDLGSMSLESFFDILNADIARKGR